MDKIMIPHGAQEILETLQFNGYEAYVVGGCVRDSLLGVEPKDWDICTSAIPSRILYSFRDKRVIETGLKHGTVTVVMDDGQYEVTTFRVDGDYSDHRHPDSVNFTESLREDLARRDFTINAMAYSEKTGLVDPFGGAQDLKRKVISCVGNPNDRFSEDALRILRALRFASTYQFDIDNRTSKAIHSKADTLNEIAAERIRVELCKLLSGKGVLCVLMDYSDVIATIIPELRPCIGFEQNNRYHQYTVYNHIAHAVENYKGNDDVVNVALLLHDIGKPLCYTEDERGGHFHGHGVVSHDIAEVVLDRLRFDNKSKADILELVLYHDSVIEPAPRVVKRWLNKIGEVQFLRLMDIRIADILAHAVDTQQSRIERHHALVQIEKNVIEEEQCFKLKDMNINGKDLIEIGVPEGKRVGMILDALLESVISGYIPNDHDILVWCAKMLILVGGA
ncbi:CCA tRNA nucleotidyltransferase [Intestinimonas butyriciproducens]|uniref:CCA tRNA nucleotidyltransferase n=1 Tax=Intestinimonas butyriciproducens TaxID=1297617 RepID=UPI00189798D3|nr:HD domain-containing protein [Intestinimonas butyriciproducens]MDB7829171.1 HD domain-containing protein [Intestinimonas butyriciproducens]